MGVNRKGVNLGAVVIAAISAAMCVRAPYELPVPNDPSWEGSLERGARAPRPEEMHTAVVAYALHHRPTFWKNAPAVIKMCLTILPPYTRQRNDRDDPPLYERQLMYPLRPDLLNHLQTSPIQTVSGSDCYGNIAGQTMTLEIGKVVRRPDSAQYEVDVTVTRNFAWNEWKLLMNYSEGVWRVAQCLDRGEWWGSDPNAIRLCDTDPS